jgi:hypothetical protein
MLYKHLVSKFVLKTTLASAPANVFTIASDLYFELLTEGEKLTQVDVSVIPEVNSFKSTLAVAKEQATVCH